MSNEQRITKLLQRLDTAWAAFNASYAGLSEAELTRTAFADGWSVQDVIAHLSTWEQEALTHLPLIIAGGRPPRYAAQGGIDAFNARMTEQKRRLSVVETLRQRDDIHQQLVAFVRDIPADQLAAASRVRRRLRLDTYAHYPLHAAAIRQWRERGLGR
jgi:hypothetical protein